MLNQFTANAINRPVLCGPTEATAVGNLMIQAMALGQVKDLSEIRRVIKVIPDHDYAPGVEQWDDAYQRF